MGVIKDSLNKGFTIGDTTTTSYDGEAKIKVKEYYELDKLERRKLLELASNVDMELDKRDIKIGELEEKIENVSRNDGGNTGGSLNVYYPPADDSYYVLYKKIITQAEINEKCNLKMTKYNNMTNYEKSNFEYVLGDELGYQLPVTIEKIRDFIDGKPTGKADKNLMYICKQFSECIELNTNLNLEFYKTDFNDDYISENLSYYKLCLPKLTIYINSNKELIFSEREAFGIWKMSDLRSAPMYNSLGCPVIVGYTVLENGDYEITISLNAYYKNYYLLKTNVEAEKVTSLPNIRKNLAPLTEFNYKTIFYNAVLDYAPVNINYYLNAIPLEKIQFLHINNTMGTQVNEVNMQFHFKEDITITADNFTNKKVEIFRNLGILNIDGIIEIELIGNYTENIKAQLTRSSLSIIVPKGETLTLKKSVSYKYRGSFINKLRY